MREEPDSQEAALAARRSLQLRDGLVSEPDDLARGREQCPAVRCQLDLARRTDKELAAEVPLERADLRRESGCAMRSRAAARLKLSSSATAMK